MLFITFDPIPWPTTIFLTIVTLTLNLPPSLILDAPSSMHQSDCCGDHYSHFPLT